MKKESFNRFTTGDECAYKFYSPEGGGIRSTPYMCRRDVMNLKEAKCKGCNFHQNIQTPAIKNRIDFLEIELPVERRKKEKVK